MENFKNHLNQPIHQTVGELLTTHLFYFALIIIGVVSPMLSLTWFIAIFVAVVVFHYAFPKWLSKTDKNVTSNPV